MAIDLFSPVTLGPYELRNRIVMAPMTRNRASRNNVPHTLNALYYAQRASAGLIVTEGTQVSPQGQGYLATPGIHSRKQTEGWRTVTAAVHAAGGHIFAQLWHVGRISHRSFQPDGGRPVAPSAITPQGQIYTADGVQPLETPRALTEEEIVEVVEDFRRGAENALAAGFDGIELHGANGYLIDQFLRDSANHRTDRYGGPVESRIRFLTEVLDAVSAVIGPERVGLRISPENTYNDISDSDPQTLFSAVARAAASRGIGYLHVIEGDMVKASGGRVDYRALRALFNGRYIVNHALDKASANAAIAQRRSDLVAFGKPFISNPDLVTRLLLGAPLSAPNPETFYGGTERGYTDYALLQSAPA